MVYLKNILYIFFKYLFYISSKGKYGNIKVTSFKKNGCV